MEEDYAYRTNSTYCNTKIKTSFIVLFTLVLEIYLFTLVAAYPPYSKVARILVYLVRD